MTTAAPEQQAVIDSSARVRVVRAAPGSGKTWLVAELIRQELNNWGTRTSGIAALSFTRVGGEEIHKAVGYEVGHPHFVGTIDAFLYRYVIRPFLRHCFPRLANPRLVPGDWGAQHWGHYGPKQKTTIANGINLFGCVFIDKDKDGAVIAHKPHPAQPLQRLTGDERKEVQQGKKALWEKTGQLTHSDAAFLASTVLNHKRLGPIVRSEIIRRFPILIIDELQDTGYFLGESMLLLLREAKVRGVVVGDPDQAIYEFNGARPDLFARFEALTGAAPLPLSSSRRFGAAIATAAEHVKDCGGTITPAGDKTGRPFLVRYNDMTMDVSRIVAAVRAEKRSPVIKVVARQTATVDALTQRSAKPAPKLGCPSLNHLQRAVPLFRQGRQVGALAAVRAALDLAVFGHEGVTDEQLVVSKIAPDQWKDLAVKCLLRANGVSVSGTQFYWQTQVGTILDEELTRFGLGQSLAFAAGTLKPQKRPGWNKECATYFPQPGAGMAVVGDVSAQTVHSVKGETHDLTLYVCPDTTAARCPSEIWWSTADKDREEKRIAYVAMTRTQGDLILCVSEACYARLSIKRQQFVSCFECMTVDEYIAERSAAASEPAAST